MTRISGVPRLVLPSPNGSTICAALAGGGVGGSGAGVSGVGGAGVGGAGVGVSGAGVSGVGGPGVGGAGADGSGVDGSGVGGAGADVAGADGSGVGVSGAGGSGDSGVGGGVPAVGAGGGAQVAGAGRGPEVVAASLRNAAAVADWLAPRVAARATVALVPAGERWPDGSLRPAAEDLWGAGAVLAGLPATLLADPVATSPEARVAVAAWRSVADRLPAELAACAGGRELADLGFADDVAVAAQVGASGVVPILVDGEFRPAPVM
ncbi:2-phosphosulfolactate phosphatase [Nocardioides sp. zg-578]|nr:2-phosphosulfolactate phosphatase [Nocardioides marmotae]MTB83425.1 hypothetical protein [Nocardioides marmotae]